MMLTQSFALESIKAPFNKNHCWPIYSCVAKRNAHLMAGHITVAISEGLEVTQAYMTYEDGGSSWIEIVEPNLSDCWLGSSARDRGRAKSVLIALLAGPAAQIRYSFGYYPMKFNLSNSTLITEEAIWRAISIAGRISSNGPILINDLWDETMQEIGKAKNWEAIEAIAAALLNNGELLGCELKNITRHAAQRSG